MDNKIMLEGLLWDLKGLSDLVMHGSLESGTNKVNKLFRDSLIEILDLQHTLYGVMSDNDMYSVCEVEESKISETRDSYSPSLNDM